AAGADAAALRRGAQALQRGLGPRPRLLAGAAARAAGGRWPMRALVIVIAALVFLAAPTLLSAGWVSAAGERMVAVEVAAPAGPATAIAQQDNAGYCSVELKQVLRRVLQSCGLLGSGQVRGCQPADARQVAALAGDDFNALFTPMAERAGVVQFDLDGVTLDDSDREMIDTVFADQRGASYFFVVSRASPEGSV